MILVGLWLIVWAINRSSTRIHFISKSIYSFRMIWWSDWGKQPRIERSGQDGSGRVTIVGDGLYWPNALTLDVYKKRVYFVDAKLDFIDMCDYDGANRKRLIENRDVSLMLLVSLYFTQHLRFILYMSLNN